MDQVSSLTETKKDFFLEFLDVLPDISIGGQFSSSVICICSDGNVYLYPFSPKTDPYLGISKGNAGINIESIFNYAKSQSPTFNHTSRILFNETIRPTCIHPFDLCKDPPIQAYFRLSSDKKLLLAYGVLHKKIPSLCVYAITPTSLELLYSDAILGISAACFLPGTNLFISLPRDITGVVSFLSIPTEHPKHFEHRVIPRIIFAGHHTTRMTNITMAPVVTFQGFQFATWNNDEKTAIGLWKLINEGSQLKWITRTIRPTVDIFIRDIQFDPTGKFIMLVINYTMDRLTFCVWSIQDQNIVQSAFSIKELGKIVSMSWVGDSFMVITDVAIFRMPKAGGVVAFPQTVPQTVGIIEYLDHRISVTSTGVVYDSFVRDPISRNSYSFTIQKEQPIPYIKIITKGNCDGVAGLHLYRCENCKIPLLHPLVSRTDDASIECCYCSLECQQKHWPSYVAWHKPVFFNIDDE